MKATVTFTGSDDPDLKVAIWGTPPNSFEFPLDEPVEISDEGNDPPSLDQVASHIMRKAQGIPWFKVEIEEEVLDLSSNAKPEPAGASKEAVDERAKYNMRADRDKLPEDDYTPAPVDADDDDDKGDDNKASTKPVPPKVPPRTPSRSR